MPSCLTRPDGAPSQAPSSVSPQSVVAATDGWANRVLVPNDLVGLALLTLRRRGPRLHLVVVEVDDLGRHEVPHQDSNRRSRQPLPPDPGRRPNEAPLRLLRLTVTTPGRHSTPSEDTSAVPTSCCARSGLRDFRGHIEGMKSDSEARSRPEFPACGLVRCLFSLAEDTRFENPSERSRRSLPTGTYRLWLGLMSRSAHRVPTRAYACHAKFSA